MLLAFDRARLLEPRRAAQAAQVVGTQAGGTGGTGCWNPGWWHRWYRLLEPRLVVQVVRVAGTQAGGTGGTKTKSEVKVPVAAQLGFPVGQASDESKYPLAALCLGLADMGKELHASPMPKRENFLYALQRCVLVARAYKYVLFGLS